jgi:hypothetical protein
LAVHDRGLALMAPGVLRTFAAAGVVGFAELVLLRKIHRSFRDGVVSVDLNFFSDMASNAGDSDLAFRRTELPGFYWTILVARVGVS